MQKATLKTLAPVHIGNGLTLNKDIDFVVQNGKVGFVNEEKILNLVGGTDNVGAWVSAIDKGTPILTWLEQERGLRNIKLEQIASRLLPIRTACHSTQLKTHYRTSMQGVCIPGSSLKGALKTAVWDSITDENMLSRFTVNDLKNSRGRWAYDTADKKLFGKIANDKSTRFLKIGDIHFGSATTEVYEFQILNKRFEQWETKRGQQMLIECIPTGASATFEYKLDNLLLTRNKDKYPDTWRELNTGFISQGKEQLAKLVNDFTLELLNWEIDELEKENLENHDDGTDLLDDLDRVYKLAEKCQPDEFVIRVGGHSGWKFTTGGWIRKEALRISEFDLKSIRKTIQRNRDYDMALWPKTRKVSERGQVFGFVKVSL